MHFSSLSLSHFLYSSANGLNPSLIQFLTFETHLLRLFVFAFAIVTRNEGERATFTQVFTADGSCKR